MAYLGLPLCHELLEARLLSHSLQCARICCILNPYVRLFVSSLLPPPSPPNCVPDLGFSVVESWRSWGWRGGSVSPGCSSRGPRFNSQHSHGGSQLSVTPVLGDSMLFWPLHVLHACGTDTHVGRTPIPINKTIIKVIVLFTFN